MNTIGSVQSLNSLTPNSSVQKTEGEKVAEQFEALFTHLVLKASREANKSFESELFQNHATDMYEDMLDDALSKHLAETKSLGLSAKIAEQLHLNNQDGEDHA